MRHRDRALLALQCLSLGDAFGAAVTHQLDADHRTLRRRPEGTLRWSAHTVMASAVVRTLAELLEVDETRLLAEYVIRYRAQPKRDWSVRLTSMLERVEAGGDPVVESKRGFERGSWGNTAGVIGAPVGAFFAEHPARAADEARRAAQVTHRDGEGVAGAIATAVAAAYCATSTSGPPATLLTDILRFVPHGRVRDGIAKAAELGPGKIDSARIFLGNGSAGASADTVPTALWFVARYGGNPLDAMWQASRIGGDLQTLCAIIGGVTGGADPLIPPDWIEQREALTGEFAAWGLL